MILGCFGLTGLLIFNISFIFKSINITNNFEKKDKIHDNSKIFESFIKREILKLKLLKLLKMNIFSNLGKIFSNRKQIFFFKILWKLLKKIVKNSFCFLFEKIFPKLQNIFVFNNLNIFNISPLINDSKIFELS